MLRTCQRSPARKSLSRSGGCEYRARGKQDSSGAVGMLRAWLPRSEGHAHHPGLLFTNATTCPGPHGNPALQPGTHPVREAQPFIVRRGARGPGSRKTWPRLRWGPRGGAWLPGAAGGPVLGSVSPGPAAPPEERAPSGGQLSPLPVWLGSRGYLSRDPQLPRGRCGCPVWLSPPPLSPAWEEASRMTSGYCVSIHIA